MVEKSTAQVIYYFLREKFAQKSLTERHYTTKDSRKYNKCSEKEECLGNWRACVNSFYDFVYSSTDQVWEYQVPDGGEYRANVGSYKPPFVPSDEHNDSC